ncbi:MAG: ribosome small subunit-dependent GTPase A [Saprospiraceae bacterium]|nr:ribosome small subunit-dependent GTPase A [Bacteroidia bacterium]NNF21622.1 ribosome small subunit-dependent GTPase A [Saprospiraceae bacterium]
MKGLIVRSTGSWYDVQLEDGSILPSRMIGKFRLEGKKVTNPVAVGDIVMIQREAKSENGIIKTIEDRRNYVIRQSPRKKHFLHIIAANIDQAILIVTIKDPKLKQGFIDRFLLMTEPYDIPVHIFFNKSDLYGEKENSIFEFLKDLYEKIGYSCYLTSAMTGVGLDQMNTLIEGKTTLFSGQSGVGKSSLINLIKPGLELKTKELSDFSGKGQHTTTFAEMFDLGENTRIIDTPGIKTLSYNHLEVQDVAHNFREFFVKSSECKYADCTHRNEPNCAVKSAIESDEISELRYMNYLQILEDIEDQNYWERNINY